MFFPDNPEWFVLMDHKSNLHQKTPMFNYCLATVTPPGSGLDKSRSLSDISLTESSRTYSGAMVPRARRYANMLCVLGTPTKQSPTGVTTPRPSTGRQARHGSSAYKIFVSHAHIITKFA